MEVSNRLTQLNMFVLRTAKPDMVGFVNLTKKKPA